jgi:hypothetical protein
VVAPQRVESGPAPVRKTATVSVAAVTAAGRGGQPSGNKRAEVDAHNSAAAPSSSSSRPKRDKPLPSSVDEMPKVQERGSKVGYRVVVTDQLGIVEAGVELYEVF